MVDAHQFLADLFLKFVQIAVLRLSEGRYQIGHRVEYVHDLLLADAETHVGLGLALGVLVLYADVQALLVEIRSRLIIVKIFKLFGDAGVLF